MTGVVVGSRGLSVRLTGSKAAKDAKADRAAKAARGEISGKGTGPDEKEKGKELLGGIDFFARPGELTAILGPSGSGKTTFLNAVSGRLSARSTEVKGEVVFGGHTDLVPRVNELSAYVMQEDYFLEFLTVEETIHYAARLRLPKATPTERQAVIDRLIDDLGLRQALPVQIGGRTFKGISGGQRKRVSIAMALLSSPAVLFLDEPTSGLDAALALDVVEVLHKLARERKQTVVCTIHQPRYQVYALFHSLMLLRAGKVVYAGPAPQALDFFKSIHLHCPNDISAPDFFLDLLSADNRSEAPATAPALTDGGEAAGAGEAAAGGEAAGGGKAAEGGVGAEADALEKGERSKGVEYEEGGRVFLAASAAEKLWEHFEASEYGQRYKAEMAEALGEVVDRTSLLSGCEHRAGFLQSIWILFRRNLIEGRRNPEVMMNAFAQSMFMAFMTGTIWWRVTKPDPTGECDVTTTRNYFAAVTQLVTHLAFSTFQGGINITHRRPLINREAAGGFYHRTAALTANFLVDACFHYIPPLTHLLIVYWSVGYRNTAEAFFTSVIASIVYAFTFFSYATALGSLAPSADIANAILPLGTVILFQTSGFQLADSDIPKFLIWIKAINPFRYSIQGFSRLHIDPSDSGYLDRCMGFDTPGNFWYTLLAVLAFGLVAKLFCYTHTHFLHRNQGVQA